MVPLATASMRLSPLPGSRHSVPIATSVLSLWSEGNCLPWMEPPALVRGLPNICRHSPARAGLQLHEELPMLGTIILVVLVLMLLGALPTGGYSRSWGYAPTGVLVLLVVIALIMLLTGRI